MSLPFRIRLFDQLYAGGIIGPQSYLARLPRPVRIHITPIFDPTNTFNGLPDDDVMLRVNGVDLQQNYVNVADADAAGRRYDLTGDVRIGHEVEVITIDTHGSGWANFLWHIRIVYSSGEDRHIRGGTNDRGASNTPIPSPQPPDYYQTPQFIEEHPNGRFFIPPPSGVPWPRHLRHLIELSQKVYGSVA